MTRRAVPLPRGVRSFAIAATAGQKRGDLRDRLLGDGLVPVSSALGRHDDPHRALGFPRSRQWIGYGMGHLDLLARREVSERIVQWFAAASGSDSHPLPQGVRTPQRPPGSR